MWCWRDSSCGLACIFGANTSLTSWPVSRRPRQDVSLSPAVVLAASLFVLQLRLKFVAQALSWSANAGPWLSAGNTHRLATAPSLAAQEFELHHQQLGCLSAATPPTCPQHSSPSSSGLSAAIPCMLGQPRCTGTPTGDQSQHMQLLAVVAQNNTATAQLSAVLKESAQAPQASSRHPWT